MGIDKNQDTQVTLWDWIYFPNTVYTGLIFTYELRQNRAVRDFVAKQGPFPVPLTPAAGVAG